MNNKIYGDVELINASIDFNGDNNIFYCEEKLRLENCKVRFTASNSLIYIDSNSSLSFNMWLGNDSVIYIGKNCYMNGKSHLYATERKNILIGNQLLLSFENYFRTADPHIIYDTDTKKRLNTSKSILIGDHVWIGQQSLILKGTEIGSGAIVGGHSVVSNKKIASNSLYVGNPVRKIKHNVFYGYPSSTHDFDEEMELNSTFYKEIDPNQFVYDKGDDTVDFKQLDCALSKIKTSSEKIKYIQDHMVKNQNKNRFFISLETK